MIIELHRALTPEDMQGVRSCAICGQPFRAGSVMAWAMTDDRYKVGALCAECVELLGGRYPERFPSIEEFAAAKRCYPEPVLSDSEYEAASWEEADEAYRATFIGRA